MPPNALPSDRQEEQSQHVAAEEEVRAWEEIEPGRFMPRRICGSFRGGKLG